MENSSGDPLGLASKGGVALGFGDASQEPRGLGPSGKPASEVGEERLQVGDAFESEPYIDSSQGKVQFDKPSHPSSSRGKLVKAKGAGPWDGFFDPLTSGNRHRFYIGLVIAGLLVGVSYIAQRGMDGPRFLGWYLLSFSLVWFVSEILRTWDDSASIAIPAAVSFAGIGLVRVVDGVAHGMQKFSALYGMMVVGTALIIVGARILLGPKLGRHWWARVALPLVASTCPPVAILAGLTRFAGSGGWDGGGGDAGGGDGGGCGGGGCGGCGGGE